MFFLPGPVYTLDSIQHSTVCPEIIYISDVNFQNVQQWNNFTVTQDFLEYIAREETQKIMKKWKVQILKMFFGRFKCRQSVQLVLLSIDFISITCIWIFYGPQIFWVLISFQLLVNIHAYFWPLKYISLYQIWRWQRRRQFSKWLEISLYIEICVGNWWWWQQISWVLIYFQLLMYIHA